MLSLKDFYWLHTRLPLVSCQILRNIPQLATFLALGGFYPVWEDSSPDLRTGYWTNLFPQSASSCSLHSQLPCTCGGRLSNVSVERVAFYFVSSRVHFTVSQFIHWEFTWFSTGREGTCHVSTWGWRKMSFPCIISKSLFTTHSYQLSLCCLSYWRGR